MSERRDRAGGCIKGVSQDVGSAQNVSGSFWCPFEYQLKGGPSISRNSQVGGLALVSIVSCSLLLLYCFAGRCFAPCVCFIIVFHLSLQSSDPPHLSFLYLCLVASHFSHLSLLSLFPDTPANHSNAPTLRFMSAPPCVSLAPSFEQVLWLGRCGLQDLSGVTLMEAEKDSEPRGPSIFLPEFMNFI